jgi:hypothetical protein
MKFVKAVVAASLIATSAGAAFAQPQVTLPTVSSKYGATATTQVVAPAPAQTSAAGTWLIVGLALAILAAAAD